MRRRLQFQIVITLLAIVCAPGSGALAQDLSNTVVRVTPYPGRSQVAPGGNLRIAVIFDHERGWHIHTNNPQVPPELGDASLYVATRIDVTTPESSPLIPHPSRIKWPAVTMENVGFGGPPVPYGVFAERAVAYIPVTVRHDAEPNTEATINLAVTYQACDDEQCLMPVEGARYAITVTITPPGAAPPFEDTDGLFAGFPEDVWSGLDYGPEPATEGGGAPTLLWIAVGVGALGIAVIVAWLVLRR